MLIIKWVEKNEKNINTFDLPHFVNGHDWM